ncbi:MAG: tetratricopeptide repeat protein [Nitrospirae bacterium]|nr:tetratricopeptide repeat protein [Nitrospirota bacterium]
MPPSAVILTALPIEYKAVREHLSAIREEVHPQGNVYEKGVFSVNGLSVEIGIVQLRKGNVRAGVQTERAITHFKPNYVFFVGVAGGVKDVSLGDVVVAEKVYGYESGKAGSSFYARPEMGIPSFGLIERAQAEARKGDWLRRIKGNDAKLSSIVSIGPIAAGEKVISSKRSITFQFLKANYGDTLAVEMEGHGFLEAVNANRGVAALVIRGISDLISGKGTSDKAGWQEVASRNASAFTFEILAKLIETGEIDAASNIPDDVKQLFEDWKTLRDTGRYEDAKSLAQKALALAEHYKNGLTIAQAKYCLAVLLREWDKKPADARALLQECLQELRGSNSEKRLSATLYELGVLEIDEGDLDQAEAYVTQALDIDKKRGRKISIVQDHIQLGWISDHRGHSKEAIEFYDYALTGALSVYQDHDSDTEKDAIQSIAACYQHKGLVYEREGKVEEVASNYIRALEWHRKSGYKPDLGKILYLLARLKYREGQYDEGSDFLNEATLIYSDIGDHVFHARCLDLKGRLLFTLGQVEKATATFEAALTIAEKCDDYKDQESYLNKLGHIYLEGGKLERAKEFFERARELSQREGLIDGYASSVKNLALIANKNNNPKERDGLLSDGIKALEKLLHSIQTEPRRAFIIGNIGFFYEMTENFREALTYYQRSQKAYEALSDVGGIAHCLGSIARMKGLLGEKNEEFDIYRSLKKLVAGTPYYDIIAGTAINLGEIQMQLGNLEEAKILFQEAELLCRKFNLQYSGHLRKSLQRLQEKINLRKPPGLNFKQLVEELFELVRWFPEAQDSTLRLWMWGRQEDLLGNYRNNADIKFMLCEDILNRFLAFSEILHPITDLCLQAISAEYPGAGVDVIPYPRDKVIFFDCAIPTVKRDNEYVHTLRYLSGGISSRYHLTAGTVARSKVTGNEGVTITGWSLGLPSQAHELILTRSPEELIDRKVFFLPYERHLADDKLLSDINFSKDLGLIPVYVDVCPPSENVALFASKNLHLPLMATAEVSNLRPHLRRVKQTISKLLTADRDSARNILNDLQGVFDELSDSSVAERSINMQFCIFEFFNGMVRDLYPALLITGYQPE